LFTLTTSGIFAFFLARQPQDVLLHRFPPVKPCASENFPNPLVIVRLGATLTRPWNTTREKKKAFAQGLNGGTRSRKTLWGCLSRKNAKIPEVVKVNNYQILILDFLKFVICNWTTERARAGPFETRVLVPRNPRNPAQYATASENVRWTIKNAELLVPSILNTAWPTTFLGKTTMKNKIRIVT
jgi:hypothetical protein